MSAGNTGALLALVSLAVGQSGGGTSRFDVNVPAINGRGYDMLNLGANAGCRARHQYAVMGSYCAENVRGFKNHAWVY